MQKTDIVVIGAGPIGLFSVFQAGMLKMQCHVVEALETIGGQCTLLYPEKPIYDIPAYPKILAEDLIKNLESQSQHFKPKYHLAKKVMNIIRNNDDLHVILDDNAEIICRAVLISSGAGVFTPNRPNIEGIDLYEDKYIFFKITDKNIFRNKKIVIAGGGDSAIDWAIELSKIASHVSLVHRRTKFKRMDELQGLVEIIAPYNLKKIKGDNRILEKVIVGNDSEELEIDAQYLLPFFGLNTELGPIKNWGLNCIKSNIIVDPVHCFTNLDGIYAAGDVAHYDGKLKLILTGFSEAAHAMHHIAKTIFPEKNPTFEHSTMKGLS